MNKPLPLTIALALVFAFSAMGASAQTCGGTTGVPCTKSTDKLVIKNSNRADIMNCIKSKSNSGFNRIFSNLASNTSGKASVTGLPGAQTIGSGAAAATSTNGVTANSSTITVSAPSMGSLGTGLSTLGTTTPTSTSSELLVENHNTACIENNVDSNANSGGNIINSNSGDTSSITSGSATADSFSTTDANTSTISVSR